MNYLLQGDPREIEKVIRENRIRVQRGLIKFSPVVSGTEPDSNAVDVTDTKNPPAPDTKTPKPKRKKTTE